MKQIFCPICSKWFKSLGYARHRTMHYEAKLRENAQQKNKVDLQTATNTRSPNAQSRASGVRENVGKNVLPDQIL